ncbi:GAS2-like protein pickled eggs [Caerostris darwini]|uniref:GAS2-like protein pickled eggs n=1 Tax=Caerostris darwini TaxID=1538125 RepID=A0AAV4SWM5_9ARAC|nr:GAS2-like protein pickled eggs [Caerostris darwini]
MEDCDNQMVTTGNGFDPPDFEVTLLEPRPFRPFKSSEEYLYAMKEDLAEWLNGLYEGLDLDADNFLEQMETGVILCQHANNVVRKAREYYRSGNAVHGDVPIPDRDVVYRYDVLPETFHARDNVSNFISWCRSLNIKECLLFETDDLVLRKNERSFILCLLEVARKGVKFGMPAPLLVQLEQEIDAEIANDDDGYETLHTRQQVVTNDLRSLHERVVELLSRCTCPSQFPMIRVADGKYRIGDTKVLIFVRILRSHVMVRVGGGWDTLEHYLDKHDPCRCRSGHRLSTSAKLTMVQGKSAIPSMHVTYNRPTQPPSSNPSSPQSHRRSLSYMSPTTARRCHHPSSSPPTSGRPLPIQPLPCSDDSSTSSLQDTLERKTPPKIPPRRVSRDGATSSDEDIENSDDESFKRMPRRSIERRELVFKDTVPSSWKYSPGFPRKEYPQQPVAIAIGTQRKMSDGIPSSRLPALTPRTDNKQPPKVGKVSPRPHVKQNWNETRSQSSEDLFQTPSSGPAQTKNLIFHSRGPSPVNIKGRNASIEGSFRRNDPKRHSSPRINQRSNPKMQLSPPKFISRSPVLQQTVRNVPNGQPTRRMFWSPERSSNTRTVLQRKNSAPSSPDKMASPVLEKLLQHSDLCTDKNFIEKIEQLIAEFQAKTKFEDSNEYDEIQYNSLPVNLNNEIDSKPIRLQAKKLSFENNAGKSPSKIPLPTWYSKCHS